MGVAGHLYVLQVLQGHRASFRCEDAAQRLAAQHVEHLKVQEVWHVNPLSRLLDPFPDGLGVRTGIQEDRNYGRSVEDDQRPLAEVARIIGITHPTNCYLRRLVQLHRFPTAQAFHHLAQCRLLRYLLDLGEQVIGEGHSSLRGPDLQLCVQIVWNVSYLDHL